MTPRASVLASASALLLLSACSQRLSDGDVVRLCRLTVSCGSGITQELCESSTRAARTQAEEAGCGSQFGAAGRCVLRAGSCTTPPECADENQRLNDCRGGATIPDSGPRPDAGIFVPPDAGPVTRSELRQGEGGALEIFHDGTWLPICDDGFSMTEADVACRHLGFSGAASYTTVTGTTDAFWLDDVSCTGTEAFLDQCSHSGWGVENCTSPETQAVTCF